MAQQTMYPGIVNSPVTELASPIDDVAVTIPLLDAAALPAGPNIAVIGGGETAETILYADKSGNDLTGVTRGFQGTAKAWVSGVPVSRLFTEYDYAALANNIGDHETRIADHLSATSAHSATSAATASRIMMRDASGRAKVAAPSADDDIARKAEVDAAAGSASTHAARTDNPHSVTKSQVGLSNVTNVASATAATANTNAQRDANGDLTARRLTLSMANGTAPMTVTSQTLVTNLNADRVDGLHFRISSGALEYNDGSGWVGVSAVKSVQRGVAEIRGVGTTTLNITISAVAMDKAFVNVSSSGIGSGPDLRNNPRARLTSATNLELLREMTATTTGFNAAWEVIEFY